ncbi:putative signaling protein [Methylophilaceae bacterium]|nr:putative signaling protein [Methylophilaceae bacterium]
MGRMLLVFLAYYAAGKLGLLIPYVGSHITLIWLPTGIAVAAMIRWGYGSLLPIFLGAFLVNFSMGITFVAAASIAVGNTLGPFLTAFLLQYFRFSHKLERLHDIGLMIVAASTGMLISASGGVISLLMYGYLAADQMVQAWFVWWLADTVGVLLVLPMLLNINQQEIRHLWQHRTQYVIWAFVASILEWVIFQYARDPAGQFMLLAFILLPLVIWAAMRFGITGASLVVLGLCLIAVWATSNAQGPLYHPDMRQSIFALWIFMVTLALVALMITMLQATRTASELALRASETKLRGVIDGALDGIVTIDDSGAIVEFNPAAEQIFGYRRQDVIGRQLASVIIPPALRQAHEAGYRRFVETRNQRIFNQRLELTAIRADGSEFPVELTLTSLQEQGLPLVTGFIRDITERKRAEQDIRHLAFFDPLTSLPNRRLLVDRLQQAMAASARSRHYGALLFIDLDNFKALNDSKGHDYGDLLLIEVAGRLRSCIRAEDTVSRLSGDEFVVILKDLRGDLDLSLTEAKIVAEKILDAVKQPCQLKEVEHHNTCSIGISLFNGYEISVDELLKRADTAMYQAKAAGRNALRFFDPAMQAALEKRLALEAQLRVALVRNEFELFYQIQVDGSRKIFGAEVLLRWNHPEQGLLLPAQFISIAEESGLIIGIGHWVLFKACEELKRWQDMDDINPLQLAVNVSARQFRQPAFVDEIKNILQTTGADPRLLKLELTESVVLDNIEDAIEKMNELRAIGMRFSMDDFGTGYSSLAYLKRLPLSQVKIDQSFVRDIAIDPNDAAIVQTIIGMSSTLGLSVIAEGVETEAQFRILAQYGCRQFQGYLFGEPSPGSGLDGLLKSGGLLFGEESGENNQNI